MSTEVLLKYPSVFLTGLIVTLFLTPLWRAWAPRLGFMDRPGGRKIHASPIPTGGGIALFAGFHAACAVVFLLPWQPFAGQITRDWWLRFLPLSAAVILLGLMDDRRALQPKVKLLAQGLLATIAYFLDIRMQNILGVALPLWADYLGTVLWFLTLMNAFNLIDGIDGLAVGIALIASVGIALSMLFRNIPGDLLLFVGFAGACLGFLRYNFFPAKVFLGDTGSLFIGFSLAALALSTNSKGPALAGFGMPLLAAGVPLFDSLLAIWRRSVRTVLNGSSAEKGLGLDQADADHLHHRLLRLGHGQNRVALWLYAATALLAAVGVLASVFHDRALGILGLAFLLGAYTILRHLAWIELRDSGRAVLRGIVRPVRRNRTLICHIAADILILNAALLVSIVLSSLESGGYSGDLKRDWLYLAPVQVGLPFLMLLLFRAYSRVWYLARISEYISAGLAVFLGCALAWSVNLLAEGKEASVLSLTLRFLVMTGLASPAVVGIRAVARVVEDAMQWTQRGRRVDLERGPRALICGAGYRTTLFLRLTAHAPDLNRSPEFLGIVDRDEAIRGHFVHGLQVLGLYSELPVLIRKHRVEVIYLIEALNPSEWAAIQNSLRGTPVRLIRWDIVETEVCAEEYA